MSSPVVTSPVLLPPPTALPAGRSGQQRPSGTATHEPTNAHRSTQVECFLAHCRKLGLDFGRDWRLRGHMDEDTRNLIDHLGAELAGIMEDASAVAALLRGVPQEKLDSVFGSLERAAARALALTAAMRALLPLANGPTSGAGPTR